MKKTKINNPIQKGWLKKLNNSPKTSIGFPMRNRTSLFTKTTRPVSSNIICDRFE